MIFNYDKLLEGVSLAQGIEADPSYETNYMTAITENTEVPAQPTKRRAPMPETDLSVFDNLLGNINSALNEGLEQPTPRPAVEQKAFVDAAIKAKGNGEFNDAKKVNLGTQTTAPLIKMTDDSNGKLATKGAEFKKFITENLSTPDNKHLIEAIIKVFDATVMK